MTITETEPVFALETEPQFDETPEPSGTSSELTCEECGTPLEYSGRGRKPKRCPEHRQTRSASTGRRPALDNLHRELTATTYAVGKIVATFEQFDGQCIQDGALPLADALTNVAANDPKVRKALEHALASMGWGQVVMAIVAIVAPILAHHGMLRPRNPVARAYMRQSPQPTTPEQEAA